MSIFCIVKAEYKSAFKIKLVFNDNTEGVVDLSNSLIGPIYEPLKDLAYFKKFSLNSWTIAWPNGADFKPEYLYNLASHNQLA